jgi:pyruvate formate lyase activating enzyme
MRKMMREETKAGEKKRKQHALTGRITRIERFMIHDGPGIRSVLFMKGCPLRCKWCSSPQTWNIEPEVIWKRQSCTGCGQCAEACPQHAIVIDTVGPLIDRARCRNCGTCIEACPTGALRLDGTVITVEEAVRMVMRDERFYRKSGGGVTVSGGEPLSQGGFVKEFLSRCREKGLCTAVETSGCAEWEDFIAVIEAVDLLLIDIKHMDPKAHIALTGRTNELILKNIRRASTETDCDIVIRFPVIPGHNDSSENMAAMVRFMYESGLRKIDVFPFHKLGEHEYEELGMEYPARRIEVAPPEHTEEIARFFESEGIEIPA